MLPVIRNPTIRPINNALNMRHISAPGYPESVDDDFTGANGSLANTALWTTVGNPDIQNNKLSFIGAEGVPVGSTSVTSKYNLTGDFVVQADCQRLHDTITAGEWFRFYVLFDQNNKIQFSLNPDSIGYTIGILVKTGGVTQFSKFILHAKIVPYVQFKAWRTGNTVHCYYNLGASQVLADSATVTTEDVRIQFASAHVAPAPAYEFTVDNFVLNSGTVVWP